MHYLFETVKKDYSDFASGRVLYHAANATAFPVRLASEIVQRCFSFLQKKGYAGPYKVYDPCCGSAYLLTTIGLLHRSFIRELIASDVDEAVLAVAESNLSLLDPEGLARRKAQIIGYMNEYGKESHREALASLDNLEKLLFSERLHTMCVQRDITRKGSSVGIKDVNIVIADLPYGNVVDWHSESENPIEPMLDNIRDAVHPKHSIVALITDKKQKFQHEHFKRIQYFKIGKRHVVFLEPAEMRQ